MAKIDLEDNWLLPYVYEWCVESGMKEVEIVPEGFENACVQYTEPDSGILCQVFQDWLRCSGTQLFLRRPELDEHGVLEFEELTGYPIEMATNKQVGLLS